MSFTQHLADVRARFDRVALQPPQPAPSAVQDASQARYPLAWQQLLQWCHTSAAPHGPAAWHGQAANDWSIATLQGPDAAITTGWANAFARTLDGSTTLETLPGRLPGLALRARVKLHDAMWWRPRQPSDPWDAGWASTSPPAERQLQGHFLPRRATLILAAGVDSPGLAMALAALAQRSDDLRHPMRWLWVGEPVGEGKPTTRSMLTVMLR